MSNNIPQKKNDVITYPHANLIYIMLHSKHLISNQCIPESARVTDALQYFQFLLFFWRGGGGGL